MTEQSACRRAWPPRGDRRRLAHRSWDDRGDPPMPHGHRARREHPSDTRPHHTMARVEATSVTAICRRLRPCVAAFCRDSLAVVRSSRPLNRSLPPMLRCPGWIEAPGEPQGREELDRGIGVRLLPTAASMIRSSSGRYRTPIRPWGHSTHLVFGKEMKFCPINRAQEP
jgi:hypothetical protein